MTDSQMVPVTVDDFRNLVFELARAEGRIAELEQDLARAHEELDAVRGGQGGLSHVLLRWNHVLPLMEALVVDSVRAIMPG